MMNRKKSMTLKRSGAIWTCNSLIGSSSNDSPSTEKSTEIGQFDGYTHFSRHVQDHVKNTLGPTTSVSKRITDNSHLFVLICLDSSIHFHFLAIIARISLLWLSCALHNLDDRFMVLQFILNVNGMID